MVLSSARVMKKSKKRSQKKRTPCRWKAMRAQGVQPVMNQLHFRLIINTTNTRPAGEFGPLMNRFEGEDSQIVSISTTHPTFYNLHEQEHYDLTRDELAECGFVGNELTLEQKSVTRDMRLASRIRHTYKNTKGFFTVSELLKVVQRFEMKARPQTQWFGGVDAHHVYFEGFSQNREKDAYSVMWGS